MSTQRTDDQCYECIHEFDQGGHTTATRLHNPEGECVPREFAARLETELHQSQERATSLCTAAESLLNAIKSGWFSNGEWSQEVIDRAEVIVNSEAQPVRYFLDQDSSCHWYIVPEQHRQEWQKWRELDEDNEDAWESPKYAKILDGYPSAVTFTNPTTP